VFFFFFSFIIRFAYYHLSFLFTYFCFLNSTAKRNIQQRTGKEKSKLSLHVLTHQEAGLLVGEE